MLVGTLDTKGVEYGFLRDRLRAAGVDTVLVDAGIVGPAAGRAGHRARAGRRGGRPRRRGAAGGGRSRRRRDRDGRGRDRGRAAAARGGALRRRAGARRLGRHVDRGAGDARAAGRRAEADRLDDRRLRHAADHRRERHDARRAPSSTSPASTRSAPASWPTPPPRWRAWSTRRAVELGEERPLVAASQFGVTTPCITTAREELEARGYEVLTFHMTGTGGRSMESLMEAGYVRGVLDVTTTELCDELVGGVFSAGPQRLEAAGRLGIPQVVSLGALDMVNFGPRETVPHEFDDRNLYVHNAQVTLMRTTPEECAQLGREIGEKLSRATGPTALFIPLRGVSMIARRGRSVPRPGGRRGAVHGRARGQRAERRAGRARPRRQRPGLRDGDGGQARRVPDGRPMTRDEALARLRGQVASGRAIIGAGAGTGLSAKCAEAGGVDLIIIYNSGRFRMAGRGSLSGLMPYGDANAIVVEMAAEVLPIVRETPVLAGVCGTDPFRRMEVFLDELQAARLRGRAELPDGRPDRRPLPREPRGDRDGLRPRGRDDPPGPRARPADGAVRLRRRVRRGHDAAPAPTCWCRTWG